MHTVTRFVIAGLATILLVGALWWLSGERNLDIQDEESFAIVSNPSLGITNTPEITSVNQSDVALTIWSPSEKQVPSTPIPSVKKPYPNAVLMDIVQLRSKTWRENDQLHFVIPQTGEVLSFTLDRVKKQLGVVTMFSYSSDVVGQNLLITLGSKNTFANVGTLQGTFELVGNRTQGWLIPSSELPGPGGYDFVVERLP